MQTKSPGISIVIAVGISLFISSLVLGTMISIGRSFDREIDLGRSVQFYYASESGVEAAIFHKNARGKAVHMPAETGADQELQTTKITSADLESQWAVEGHTNSIVGLMREKTPIEFDLYTPGIQSLAEDPETNIVNALDDTWPFTLRLYEDSEELPTDLKEVFTKAFGHVNIKDYPLAKSGDNETFMDWSAKKLGSSGYELFRPTGDDVGVLCHEDVEVTEISFRGCKYDIVDNTQDIHILSSQDAGTGTQQWPTLGTFNTEVSFNNFLALGDNNYTQRSLLLSPNGVFQKDPTDINAPAKIPGIPYSLTLDDPLVTDKVFPKPISHITTIVNNGEGFGIQHDVSIQEKTSNTDFNYVMFD